MPLNSFISNQGTQTSILTDNTGGTGGTVIAVQKVDISGQGTAGTLWNGGVTGTINSGTVDSITNLVGGTLTRLLQGSVTVTAGTVVNNGGTVAEVTNLVGGTLTRLLQGSITVTAGTVVNNGGTVAEITNGSIRITAGTINSLVGGTLGEVTNLVGGTLTRLAQGSINVTAGTVVVTSGSMAQTAGTINTGTINTGTVTVAVGTINHGTIDAGTINAGTFTAVPYPSAQVLSAGTTSSGTIGTLIAATGAGTGIYINSLIVNAISGTPEVTVSFALQASGNQTVNRGAYPAGGGVALSFPHPSYYGTAAAALTWNMLSGSGTVSYAVTYTTKGTP